MYSYLTFLKDRFLGTDKIAVSNMSFLSFLNVWNTIHSLNNAEVEYCYFSQF